MAESSRIRRQWNLAHPEAQALTKKRWTEVNPGYRAPGARESRIRYYQKNKARERENFSAWRKANLHVMAEHERRRRARKRDAVTIPFTLAQLESKMAYWGNRCWICRGPYEAVDHVKPLVRGGPHMLANLRPICREHNSSKGRMWPFVRVQQKFQVQQLRLAA